MSIKLDRQVYHMKFCVQTIQINWVVKNARSLCKEGVALQTMTMLYNNVLENSCHMLTDINNTIINWLLSVKNYYQNLLVMLLVSIMS